MPSKGDLRILLIEDLSTDAELAKRELRKAGLRFTARRVETEEALLEELNSFRPEIVISDYAMPKFDGMRALKRCREIDPTLPFVLLTGSINEETAVACMKAGATDYVIKEHISRLPFAVLEALRKRENILKKERAEAQLRLQSAALENAANSIVITDREGTIEWVNPAFTRITGYTAEEAVGQNPRILKSGKHDQSFYTTLWDTILSGEIWHGELINRRKDGSLYTEETTIAPVQNGEEGIGHFVAIKQDVSDRKEAERERERLLAESRQRLQRVEALHAVDVAISASMDLHIILEVVLTKVLEQLEVDAADILLLSKDTQRISFDAGKGFRTRAVEQASLQLGTNFAGQAVLEQRIVQITNPEEFQQSPKFADFCEQEGFLTYFGVPLITKGKVKGVLEVYHRAPFSPDNEWLDFLNTLAGQTAIAIDSAQLYHDLQRSNLELSLAYDETIRGWSRAMDLRDEETEDHTRRVTEMTMHLARAMHITDSELVHIHRGALLHDIGKIGVPDKILLKPGKLTGEEWKIMTKHPVFAYEMLASVKYLEPAIDIPYCHHEKWDGSGYPRGLKGEEIPLSARIFAVVDVWDALTSDRPYRAAWSKKKALQHIRDQSGIHFDPEVVKAFLEYIPAYQAKK